MAKKRDLKLQVASLSEVERTLRQGIMQIESERRQYRDRLSRAEKDLENTRKIRRTLVRVTDSRGQAQDIYEGRSAESFALFATEILWPLISRDLSELGDSAQIKITGRVWEE